MKKKLCFLLLMLLPLMAMAQQQHFSGSFSNEKLENVLQTIKKKTGVKFVYNSAVVKNAGHVTATADNETVKGFLDRILPKLQLVSTWQDDVCVIRSSQKGKLIHVYGVVTDYNNDPLPGVSVRGRDSKIHTVTDENGKYNITATEQEVLTYNFIGMKQRIVVCDRANIDVKMQEDIEYVDDVVVIGYQDIDRSKLTSSVTSLKMSEIQNPGLTTIDKMLEGHVPGMIYMQNSGQVGATPKIRIRGTSTLVGNREPVWVLDGIVLNDPVPVDPNNLNDPDFVNLLGNAISGLNPNDIDEINVLKDASATALYGAKAGNGVIVITTKKGKVGAPSVTYNGTMTYTRRPRYSDRDVYMMTSAERLDVSKELIERGMYYNNVTQWSGYEQAL